MKSFAKKSPRDIKTLSCPLDKLRFSGEMRVVESIAQPDQRTVPTVVPAPTLEASPRSEQLRRVETKQRNEGLRSRLHVPRSVDAPRRGALAL
jgi:hypothetical protein